jgi:hypothetical protein
MQMQGSFVLGRIRCHRRLPSRTIDRASFCGLRRYGYLMQDQYHGRGSSERYEVLHFSRIFGEGCTQVSHPLDESLVRYASLPNKATKVTKPETNALRWQRVWREDIDTPSR